MSEQSDKKKTQEQEFFKRVAEVRSQSKEFPWTTPEIPQFELPAEQTKLWAEIELEDPNLSDEEAEQRALYDLISRTYNFRVFYKRLAYELRRANRYDRALSLLLIAVDGLDRVNKQFGIEPRDVIVTETARVLLACIRDVDIAGRCREDAFGVILPETPRGGAEVAAERIRTRLEYMNIDTNHQRFTITVSIGVSWFQGRPLVDEPFGGQSPDAEELFGRAAGGLLQRIKEGGNGVTYSS